MAVSSCPQQFFCSFRHVVELDAFVFVPLLSWLGRQGICSRPFRCMSLPHHPDVAFCMSRMSRMFVNPFPTFPPFCCALSTAGCVFLNPSRSGESADPGPREARMGTKIIFVVWVRYIAGERGWLWCSS